VSFSVSSQLDRRVHDDDLAEPRGVLVLLAVDEPSIARMLTRVFKKAGTNVLWMGGFAQSLDWLRDRPLEVTHLFVDCPSAADDVVEFSLNALSLRPGLKLLLAGGAEISDVVGTLSDCTEAVHVPKPYLPTELAWQLRSPHRRQPQ
jgi:DNA-binding response OmpR family regulator